MRLICHFVQAASEVVAAADVALTFVAATATDAKSRDMLIVPLGP